MIAGEGKGNMCMWGEGDYRCHPGDLLDPKEIGTLAGKTAVKFLGAKPIATGKMTVVFSKHVSGQILGAFGSAIDGNTVFLGGSCLCESLGKQIFPPNMSIVCDPNIPGLSGSVPFDHDGVASKRVEFVKDGVLQTFEMDLESAKKLGGVSTGTAGAGNFYMENGGLSHDKLIADIEYGFYVMDFMGHGPDIATGDFSSAAKGFLIENGKITAPVQGVTVAGNLLDIWKNLVRANDMELGRYNTPTLRVDDLTVSGE